MSRRFWFKLALSLASVALLSPVFSVQAQPPRPKIKPVPVNDPSIPGLGGGTVQIIIIVIVTTPNGTQERHEVAPANYQKFVSEQNAKGNKVAPRK